MDTKSDDAFPMFTKEDCTSLNYYDGSLVLHQQLDIILSTTNTNTQKLYINKLAGSLEKLKKLSEYFKSMFHSFAVLGGMEKAINHSNIDIVKLLCKYNNTSPTEVEDEKGFNFFRCKF